MIRLEPSPMAVHLHTKYLNNIKPNHKLQQLLKTTHTKEIRRMRRSNRQLRRRLIHKLKLSKSDKPKNMINILQVLEKLNPNQADKLKSKYSSKSL